MSGKTLACKVYRSQDSVIPITVGTDLLLQIPDELIKESKKTLVWEDSIGDVPVVFKTYGHRNVAEWMEAKYFRGRCEREYERLAILHKAGVNTCEPLVVGRGRDLAHGRFEVIATRKIPYARQLKAFLSEYPHADLTGLFSTIRHMHHAGVYHGSLTLNNIVVATPPDAEPAFYVLDLPRGVDFPYDLCTSQMVWYDLAHFVHRVSDVVDPNTLMAVLDRYPFTENQREKFEEFYQGYKPSKRLRFRLRNEFSKAAKRAYRLGIPDAPSFQG